MDNQTTLLRFIVAELGANKYKEILRLPKELRHVSEAASLDYSSLKATIKALTRDLGKFQPPRFRRESINLSYL